jgi:hypothetical protein
MAYVGKLSPANRLVASAAGLPRKSPLFLVLETGTPYSSMTVILGLITGSYLTGEIGCLILGA